MSSSITLDLLVDSSDTAGAKVVNFSPPLASEEIWQTWFEHWLDYLTPTASPIDSYEISLILTVDDVIQELNHTYRHQNRPTDVLAFAAQELSLPGAELVYSSAPLPLGDIVISVETAERQRHQSANSLRQELAWLAAHGLLHLLGWDHPDEDSLRRMLEQQHLLLKTIGYSLQNGDPNAAPATL